MQLLRLYLVSLLLCAPVAWGQARTFNLVNKCTDTIWFELTTGAVGSCGSCPEGSTCGAGDNCYWNVPAPANGNFRIDPNGGTNSVTFPFYASNGQSALWSGNIGACLNGTCSASAADCDALGCGTIGGSPMTLAEFTLLKQSSDSYDVEQINGFNLPLAVYPQGSPQFDSNDPYTCGSPGAPAPLTATANCTWEFTPPSPYYVWVAAGGASCASNSDCSAYAGTVCGLSNNVGETPRFKLTCGAQFGYWTADQVCGVDMSFGSPFNCEQTLGPPNSAQTLWDLYGCTVADDGSCYSVGATTACCGCANWGTYGMQIPSNTQDCNAINPNWSNNVQPGLQWLKAACPSVYVYPFDDMSSSFTCQQLSGDYNVVNYEIVWCPGNAAASPEPGDGDGDGDDNGGGSSSDAATLLPSLAAAAAAAASAGLVLALFSL